MNTEFRALEETANTVTSRLLQSIFSFPAMLSGLLATLAVLTVRGRFDDPDMWWHLKLGEVMWTTHHIPVVDLFSYTTNHHSYIPHEWLSQLLLFAAYHFGGYSGMMLGLCLLASAVLVAGYSLCSIYSGNAKVSLLGALIIFLFGTVGFSLRPQMLGYVLLILELMVLHLGRTRNARWYWALPPMFALWVNCHGSFSFGIAVAAVSLFSSFFDFQAGLLVAKQWDPDNRRTLSLAVGLSLLALFLNPSGLRLILYPLEILFRSPINLGAVDEWKPLELDGPLGVGFVAVISCIFLVTLTRRSVLHLHEILLLTLTAVEAGRHERLVFAFGIVAAPVLCRLLSNSWEGYSGQHDHPWVNALLLGVSLLTAYVAFPTHEDLLTQVKQQSPVQAVEYIRSHQLAGPMLNDYVFGGYLIWASPDHPVFIDGRADIFEWTGVLEEYGQWATLRSPPSGLLDKYNIRFCLLSRRSPMSLVLGVLPDWKAVYSDNTSIIFTRNQPAS